MSGVKRTGEGYGSVHAPHTREDARRRAWAAAESRYGRHVHVLGDEGMTTCCNVGIRTLPLWHRLALFPEQVTCTGGRVEVVLEEFPVPNPVRIYNGRGEASAKIHLTDTAIGPDEEIEVTTLCGQTAVGVLVGMDLDQIDELPIGTKCLRCPAAMHGTARAKRLT